MSELVTNTLLILGSVSIGLVYAALVLSNVVINSTLLRAPKKNEGRAAHARVTLWRLAVFAGVSLSLLLVRPLLQLGDQQSILEPLLAIVSFIVAMIFGWRVVIPTFVAPRLTTGEY